MRLDEERDERVIPLVPGHEACARASSRAETGSVGKVLGGIVDAPSVDEQEGEEEHVERALCGREEALDVTHDELGEVESLGAPELPAQRPGDSDLALTRNSERIDPRSARCVWRVGVGLEARGCGRRVGAEDEWAEVADCRLGELDLERDLVSVLGGGRGGGGGCGGGSSSSGV
jgi:hypothetical protein